MTKDYPLPLPEKIMRFLRANKESYTASRLCGELNENIEAVTRQVSKLAVKGFLSATKTINYNAYSASEDQYVAYRVSKLRSRLTPTNQIQQKADFLARLSIHPDFKDNALVDEMLNDYVVILKAV